MSNFLAKTLDDETYWRSIILFGRICSLSMQEVWTTNDVRPNRHEHWLNALFVKQAETSS